MYGIHCFLVFDFSQAYIAAVEPPLFSETETRVSKPPFWCHVCYVTLMAKRTICSIIASPAVVNATTTMGGKRRSHDACFSQRTPVPRNAFRKWADAVAFHCFVVLSCKTRLVIYRCRRYWRDAKYRRFRRMFVQIRRRLRRHVGRRRQPVHMQIRLQQKVVTACDRCDSNTAEHRSSGSISVMLIHLLKTLCP